MRKLNNRNKLFLDTFYEHGIGAAMKVANYTKRHSYRILATKKAKEYLLEKVKKTFADLGLNYADLIQERLDLAHDPETPANVKDKILKDLAELVKAQEEQSGDSTIDKIKQLTPKLSPVKQAS